MASVQESAPAGRRRSGLSWFGDPWAGRVRDDVSRAELALAAIATTVVGAGYVLVAATHGALGVARNDDWVYYRSAFSFARDGSFAPYASTTMLVGQDVLAWPVVTWFGTRIAPLQILTVAMGVVALYATYVLVRGALGAAWSAVAVATLALGPVLGSLSTSFMTDVPAYMFSALTLLAGWYAVRYRFSVPWLVLSLVAGFAAFSIREYTVAAVVAVLLVGASKAHGESVRALCVVGVLALLWLAAVTALFVWRRTLPGATEVNVSLALGSDTGRVIAGIFTLAAFAFPATLAVSPRRLWTAFQRRKRLSGLVVGATVLVWAVPVFVDGSSPFIGNYLTRFGSYPDVIPAMNAPAVLPTAVWRLMAVAGLVSCVVMLLVGVLRLVSIDGREWRRLVRLPPGHTTPTMLLVVFVVGYLLVWTGSALFLAAPIFDRNLVPIVPATVALTLLAAANLGVLRPRSAGPVAVGLVGLTVVGFIVVDASATFDGAKWRLAEQVERLGYPAGSIDGGYEWFGLHRAGQPGVTVDPGSQSRWWRDIFPASPICATSTFAGGPGLPPGGAELARVSARSLFGIRYDLIATRGPDDCTATADGT